MKNKNTKKNSKTTTIKSSFKGGTLTNFSGIKSVHEFMEKMKIRQGLNELNIKLNHNAKYDTGGLLSIIILGILSGLNRIAKIEIFTLDPLVQRLFNIRGKISDSTIGERIKRFGMRQTTEFMDLIGHLSRQVHKKLKTREDILDLDSSVKTVYGNQEGAEKGFNSKKQGAKSYHPLFAFLDSTRECLLSWLRPGNTHTSNNASEFLKQAFAELTPGINSLMVRADSGFFSEKILSVIESQPGFTYLIKVKLKNLVKLLSSQQWEKIPGMPQWEMSDFYYKPMTWQKERRFVVVRKVRKIETEGRLFKNIEYDYFCYVTNIYESPLYLHKLYGDRGTSENWIEAVKNQMFAGSLLTSDFWANEALWLASVLAYNISIWMRKLSDEKTWREEPATFRSWFIQLAGKVVITGRQTYLKMYKAFYYQDRWKKIEEAIENLSFA